MYMDRMKTLVEKGYMLEGTLRLPGLESINFGFQLMIQPKFLYRKIMRWINRMVNLFLINVPGIIREITSSPMIVELGRKLDKICRKISIIGWNYLL